MYKYRAYNDSGEGNNNHYNDVSTMASTRWVLYSVESETLKLEYVSIESIKDHRIKVVDT